MCGLDYYYCALLGGGVAGHLVVMVFFVPLRGSADCQVVSVLHTKGRAQARLQLLCPTEFSSSYCLLSLLCSVGDLTEKQWSVHHMMCRLSCQG